MSFEIFLVASEYLESGKAPTISYYDPHLVGGGRIQLASSTSLDASC